MYTKDKSQFFKGAFLIKDGGPAIFAAPPAPPRPVRYGDIPPDFTSVSDQLDAARIRLEKLRDNLRAARRK